MCSVVKRLSVHLKNIRDLRERKELCKPDQAQNLVAEVNAKREKSSQHVGKNRKEIKREERPRRPVQKIQSTHNKNT